MGHWEGHNTYHHLIDCVHNVVHLLTRYVAIVVHIVKTEGPWSGMERNGTEWNGMEYAN